MAEEDEFLGTTLSPEGALSETHIQTITQFVALGVRMKYRGLVANKTTM